MGRTSIPHLHLLHHYCMDSGSKLHHQHKMVVPVSTIFRLLHCTVGGSGATLFMLRSSSHSLRSICIYSALIFPGLSFNLSHLRWFPYPWFPAKIKTWETSDTSKHKTDIRHIWCCLLGPHPETEAPVGTVIPHHIEVFDILIVCCFISFVWCHLLDVSNIKK